MSKEKEPQKTSEADMLRIVGSIINTLQPLEKEEQERIIQTVCVFFGVHSK